jgi:NAD(P)-dependent dehydrogenase (short-subunit alcohol dehydrogenase family)
MLGNRVEGKVALITGGASGIGAESARLLALHGAKVVIGDINIKKAEQTAQSIRRLGGVVSAVYLDAGDPGSIKKGIETAVSSYGMLNVLFNNVSFSNTAKDQSLADMDIEVWQDCFRLNLDAAMYGCRYAVPYMERCGGGSIVNTASMSAIQSSLYNTAYGISKAALLSLTKAVALQYGKKNIRCNAISPGLVITPTVEKSMATELREHYLRINCLNRFALPEDMAYAVLYFASDESQMITGQTLLFDGGLSNMDPFVPTLRGGL